MMIDKPIVHLLSGGLDSTVLLHDLLRQKCRVYCVLFDYGQRHDRELECGRHTCLELDLEYQIISLRDVFRGSSLIAGHEGSVVVPNRNGTFLSIAVAIACGAKAEAVTIGCNAEDRERFRDCRPEFIDALNSALSLTGCGVEICAPYLRNTKQEIVEIGRRLGVDFEKTWSCYAGGARPCGLCPACVTRDAAMQ